MRGWRAALLTILTLGAAAPGWGQSASDTALVKQALSRACSAPSAAPVDGAQRLETRQPRSRPGAPRTTLAEWRVGNGQKMRVTSVSQRGRTLVFVDLYARTGGAERPLLRGVTRSDCAVLGGRYVEYQSVAGKTVPVSVLFLGRGMTPDGKTHPINPPPPSGRAKACTRIGILDNGVNYARRDIASRLAYGADGRLIGLDVWENDGRPFDYGVPPNSPDPRVSLFNPRRHGSMVASVVLDYAPSDACIVPVRYPPFSRGSEVSTAARFFASAGVKVVSVQSGRQQDWPDFRRAMRAHPEMLFVVAAGNEGRDLTRSPRYPASYREPNLLVVAGTDNSERALWKRSNSGAGTVEVAVDAEDVALKRFDGSPAALSGTSFAAPKVAGYAAHLLRTNPDLSGRALKDAIVRDAQASGRAARGIPVLTEQTLRSR